MCQPLSFPFNKDTSHIVQRSPWWPHLNSITSGKTLSLNRVRFWSTRVRHRKWGWKGRHSLTHNSLYCKVLVERTPDTISSPNWLIFEAHVSLMIHFELRYHSWKWTFKWHFYPWRLFLEGGFKMNINFVNLGQFFLFLFFLSSWFR